LACNDRTMLRKPNAVPGQAVEAVPAAPAAVLVDVVVLTAEQEVLLSIKGAVGDRNPVWRARTAEEAADLLVTGRCGVLVVDTAAVSQQADTLIEQIVQQFPDVVVCVAGTRDDEPLLAPLISNGLVYRFMHKPASARRAGMFLQAAIRRHIERRDGKDAGDPLLPLLRGLQRPTAGMPRGYLALIGVIAVALTLPFLLGEDTDAIATVQVDAAPVTIAPRKLTTTGRADPVLSRARAALQAGRLEAPEGRNALDLFQAVLLAQPDQPEALASLARTVELLLARVQQEADAGRETEAVRLVQRVLTVVPDHRGAQALARKLDPGDTPSRQLSSEQEAEVEAMLAADDAAYVAADRSPPRTLEEIEAALAALPGPVSRVAAQAGTQPEAAQAVPTAPVVRPDPLRPRVINPQSTLPRVRTYAREPVNTLPIAGTSRSSLRPKPEPAAERDAPIAPGIVAADSLDRVVAREPVYPAQALRNGTRGWVELEFTVASNGAVRDVEIVAAEPRGVFDGAASEAVAAWRFRPRVVNGQPIAQRSKVTLRFDIDG
jgi:TonB family protein